METGIFNDGRYKVCNSNMGKVTDHLDHCQVRHQTLQTNLQLKLSVALCALVCSKAPPNHIIVRQKVVSQESKVIIHLTSMNIVLSFR